jgi:hypothetical protein
MLKNRQTYGPIRYTVELLRTTKKGQYMKTLETYIYKNKEMDGNVLSVVGVLRPISFHICV